MKNKVTSYLKQQLAKNQPKHLANHQAKYQTNYQAKQPTNHLVKQPANRPATGSRRQDGGQPLGHPPPLPGYRRAPHQRPLASKPAPRQDRPYPAGQRRLDKFDREVITNIHDADENINNFIMTDPVPGQVFTDFDGASSRQFVQEEEEEEGGWTVVKSLPPYREVEAGSSYFPATSSYYPVPSVEVTDSPKPMAEVQMNYMQYFPR